MTQRHRDLSLFAQRPMLGWLGAVVLHDQKRHSFCLVVPSGKSSSPSKFLALRSRHGGPCGAAGFRGVRHTRRTNGMAHGSLHAWLDQQRLDHAGLVTVSLCAPPLPPLPRFPPTHWLVQGDCVRACIPDLALHFVLLLDANCSASLSRHRTWKDATLTPSGPEKKKEHALRSTFARHRCLLSARASSSIQPVLMFSISPPCALNARFPAAANCDAAIEEPSTPAIWKTIPHTWPSCMRNRTFCWPRFSMRVPSAALCVPPTLDISLAWNSPCHLLLECPWQQRPPISSRPPSSAIGPVARSVPAPFWILAPTYFLSRAQSGKPHRRVPLALCVGSNPGPLHCAPPSPESVRNPNLFLAPF